MACSAVWVLFILFISPSLSLNPSLQNQATILVSLKQSFVSDSSLFDAWKQSNHSSLCSWPFILCDPRNQLVLSLNISNLNISGSLSPIIASLKSLENLSIANNAFSGPFPVEVSNLSSLRCLNISNNQFNGSLNWDFMKSKELTIFDAYNNDFSGSLPLNITELQKLQHLDLGGNYFFGRIPLSYGRFRRLEYLSLAGNDLSGPIPDVLANLTSLKQLYLGYFNQFQGPIPTKLGDLANLVHLDLSSCGLSGPIPSELGNLNKLDTLFLQTNQISGPIPPNFGNLTNLKSLDLSNNVIGGEIPLELKNLKNLSLMHLFINRLQGEIPGFIAELPSLEVLKLWQNNLTGVIPPKLGWNGQLRELDLSSNKLTGSIPRGLCIGQKLEILILLNNLLFGPLPGGFSDCNSLSRVRLGQNYLTGSIPREFLYLPVLSLVELHNNYLSGELSNEPSKRPAKLSQLNLSNNRLSGPIPVSIGNFSGIQNLLLGGNRFTGAVPPELGRLKRVLKIDLSRNNFTGSIPPELGGCELLTFLDLSRNSLGGAVPIELAKIRILNYLNVSSNRLNGSIPRELGTIKSLTSADFSYNNFSGRVPTMGQFSYFNVSSFVGNERLCGLAFNPCERARAQGDQTKHRFAGKFKLIIALGLLSCSSIFALTAIVKTRRWLRRDSDAWRLTAFQKLSFGSGDVAECLKENNIIGRGGAGTVYRCVTPNGDRVAVKRLSGIDKGSTHHRDNGFSAEIRVLGRIRHRNIVRLLAFCKNKETNLLVYEYMSNGSLGEVLHGKRGRYLDWEVRLKIAVEAAKGLCYLHHDCCPAVLHRDVKSNNILLDAEFEAHVADFGLAKFLRDSGASECMSAIAGSYGYIAPEYAYTLKVDEKSDVYSFGVVLLELVTGRRPVGDFGEEGLDIVRWTKASTNWNKDRVVEILDRRMSEVPVNEAAQVFFVAMLCVQEQSVERPTMREVVQMLSQAKQQS
ncbi:Leucine-rich repeat receptor-like serine/threonine-protein kinase BAM3 [Acorus calamus]|uniref:non-specific serine/threonine protein kinase n=1 Tax=Acorus calamus TaxID=4465 RepID=A0AAV9DPL6_ACOCL|nr:Leucine-rich repeat receptor-like serine/threonine-protein kinase BAM3 [Acorus calamus]